MVLVGSLYVARAFWTKPAGVFTLSGRGALSHFGDLRQDAARELDTPFGALTHDLIIPLWGHGWEVYCFFGLLKGAWLRIGKNHVPL